MSKQEVQGLKSAELFHHLSDSEIGEILALGKELTYRPGQSITDAGRDAMDFYVILEGNAQLDVPGIRTDVLTAGATFGELTVLDGGPRTASISAVGRVRALRIGRPEFIALLDRHGSIGRKLLTEVATRLRVLEDRVRSQDERG